MPRGGKRFGAGRKPGSTAKKTREIAQAILDQPGLSPLEYMVAVLRDPTAAQQRRDTFAIAAAPYTHPKLGAIAIADAAAKSMTIGAVYVVSVPNQLFLSSEQADRGYRFSHDLEGSIVTPLWQSKDVDHRDRGLKLVEDSAPRAPHDGTPTEATEPAAEVIDDEVA